jgi:hypothetical protein
MSGGTVSGDDFERLELEPEVPDARQQAVQLRLVDDLAHELCDARAAHGRHAVESGGEALAQPPAYRDPHCLRPFHGLTIRLACVRAHHAGPVSPRAIRLGDAAELESAVGRVSEREVRRGDG